MAKVTTLHGHEVWEIASNDQGLRMSFVPELGGLGISMVCETRSGPREMLWLYEDFWQNVDEGYGGWPILFPICARQARNGEPEVYQYRGTCYRQPIHGFASRMPWDAESRDDQHLVMRLVDTPETRSNYPFEFELILEYSIEASTLVCRQTYRNRGTEPLPYFAGFHPYFRTPLPGGGKDVCTVEFQPAGRYVYNEDMTDIVGTDVPLAFPAAITEPAINEQLHRFAPGQRNRSVLTLEQGLSVHVEAYGSVEEDMFPFMQLFTQEQYPFFCVEPWMGAPNGLNTIGGCRWLGAGESERAELKVTIEEQ